MVILVLSKEEIIMSGSRILRGGYWAGALALGCFISISTAVAQSDEQDLLAKEAELLRKVEENRGESGSAAAPALPPSDPSSETRVAAESPSDNRVDKIALPEPSGSDIASSDAGGAIEPGTRGKKTGKLSVASQNADLQGRLDRAQQKINGLVSELDQTRNRLMLAETEVERLNAIIEDRNRSKLESYSSRNNTPNTQPPVRRNSIRPEALPSAGGKITEDMPIATVVVDKAHLRTGPGLNNSPLMTVSVGTRLAVETRMGDWYRVISPTGTRAWVASDIVAFGLDGNRDPSKTVKVKGYDSRLEDKGFDLSRKPEPESDE
jgi:hypothetical protein